ncbi:hypothetical protein FBEOM_10245 [Fusarium beomiforme]|uniref:DUF7726 domain-containing protein n=1 Tax=Fusarium beomiforme TaxID=44412 RepID=A0A9P5ADF7_9HYPO|nr:hypothetical protein FBEOM_10245 [Fusarium beomiforme]
MAKPLAPLQPELTESIIKDKQAEAATLKENAHSKSSQVAKTTPASGKKRKAELSLDEEIAAYKADFNNTIDPASFENDHLPSYSAIPTGANSNSLNKFLKQKGPMGGSGSAVWRNAYNWFKQREVMGLKIPDAKNRQLEEKKKDTTEGTPSKTPAAKELPDISEIHLDGEETDEAPIYDNCGEIRREINSHMKIPSITQAQFCRDIYAQFKAPKCKGIQSKQLSDFRNAKGSNAGAKISVFYGAYVYFEKMRIAQGKPMTKHRIDMIHMYPGGIPRDQDDRTTWFVGAA